MDLLQIPRPSQVTIEPQPLFLEKHLPRSWRVPPGKLLPLGRLLGRAASLAHLWRLLALLAAYSLTGGVSLEVYLWSRGYSHTSGDTSPPPNPTPSCYCQCKRTGRCLALASKGNSMVCPFQKGGGGAQTSKQIGIGRACLLVCCYMSTSDVADLLQHWDALSQQAWIKP